MFDFVGISFGVELLQFGDELGDGVFSVAAGDDFETGAVEAERTFRHEENFLALIFAEADAGGELRSGVGIDGHGGGQFTVFSCRNKGRTQQADQAAISLQLRSFVPVRGTQDDVTPYRPGLFKYRSDLSGWKAPGGGQPGWT